MVIAVVALVFATTGTAFAAKELITGRDIKNGSITTADLSRKTLRSLSGRRGPRGTNGSDGDPGFPGPTGPQGSTGERGGTGPVGPVGPAGPTGLAGSTGQTGRAGRDGAPGPQGDPGLEPVAGGDPLGFQTVTVFPLRSGDRPDDAEGLELSGQVTLEAGVQYQIQASVEFTNTAAESGVAYGIGEIRENGATIAGGTITTSAIPVDGVNSAQGSLSILYTSPGGGQLSLVGAIRSDTFTAGEGNGRLIVYRVS
ncbi:MAG TPA: hypothetical protein VLK58_24265 [Conexibacter sp.]|nr:hypothetical protein [Conexibacter sp.]